MLCELAASRQWREEQSRMSRRERRGYEGREELVSERFGGRNKSETGGEKGESNPMGHVPTLAQRPMQSLSENWRWGGDGLALGVNSVEQSKLCARTTRDGQGFSWKLARWKKAWAVGDLAPGAG